MIRIFTQNTFQSISVIFCFLVPDVLKIAFSTMDLLYNRIVIYNRIILYNRTISLLVLFTFTGVTFGDFDIIYFRLALKALDIGRFSLKSSNFSKFFPNPLHIFFFFSIWVFFHEHSRFTGQQGKGEGIYLTPLYHFHPLRGHLDISWAIAAESSPLHMPRSITTTQKRVRDFHKDDALAQTNKIKYDGFFLHGTENIKKIFSQDLKLETKILGTVFQILYCSLISQGKNSVKT